MKTEMRKAKMKQYFSIKKGVAGVRQYLKLLKIEKPKHEPVLPIIIKIQIPC